MLGNFIYSKSKDLFLQELEAGNVLDEAVVFIEDTKEIWNHGIYFDGKNIDLTNYETIEESVLKLSEAKTYTDEQIELYHFVTQPLELTKNWNQISFYVDITLEDLYLALGDKGLTIQTQVNDGVNITLLKNTYDSTTNTWSGDITKLDFSLMYLIYMSEAYSTEVSGKLLNPKDIVILLNPGTNFIGYPLNVIRNINDALINLSPTTNDMFEDGSGFSSYEYNYSQWAGAITKVIPGKGYIYTNKSTDTLTFTFPTELEVALSKKQNKLILGKNISTINGYSLLKGADIPVASINGKPIFGNLKDFKTDNIFCSVNDVRLLKTINCLSPGVTYTFDPYPNGGVGLLYLIMDRGISVSIQADSTNSLKNKATGKLIKDNYYSFELDFTLDESPFTKFYYYWDLRVFTPKFTKVKVVENVTYFECDRSNLFYFTQKGNLDVFDTSLLTYVVYKDTATTLNYFKTGKEVVTIYSLNNGSIRYMKDNFGNEAPFDFLHYGIEAGDSCQFLQHFDRSILPDSIIPIMFTIIEGTIWPYGYHGVLPGFKNNKIIFDSPVMETIRIPNIHIFDIDGYPCNNTIHIYPPNILTASNLDIKFLPNNVVIKGKYNTVYEKNVNFNESTFEASEINLTYVCGLNNKINNHDLIGGFTMIFGSRNELINSDGLFLGNDNIFKNSRLKIRLSDFTPNIFIKDQYNISNSIFDSCVIIFKDRIIRDAEGNVLTNEDGSFKYVSPVQIDFSNLKDCRINDYRPLSLDLYPSFRIYRSRMTGVRFNPYLVNIYESICNLTYCDGSENVIEGPIDVQVDSVVFDCNGKLESAQNLKHLFNYLKLDYTNEDVSELSIDPNVSYIFGEVTSLSISLNKPLYKHIANEYLFEFKSGTTATTLTLPDNLLWSNGEVLTIEPNTIYQISILNNLVSYIKSPLS